MPHPGQNNDQDTDQSADRPSSDLAARRVAFDLLRGVLARRRHLVPAADPAWRALPVRDRAFAMLLVTTVLRRAGDLDAALAPLLHKPLPPRDDAVRDLLRLGAAQLLLLGTPAYAAIDSTVRLVRAAGHPRHAKFANAILRRLQRENVVLATTARPPAWLERRWRTTYGDPTATAIAAIHAQVPPLDLTPHGDPQTLAATLGGTVLPTGSVRCRDAGPVADLPGYAAGDWWVQDAAAALPARLLGEVAGAPVLDLCAAPGGKTAQLAAAGAQVTAVDRDPTRLDRLTGNLARLNLTASPVCCDARAYAGAPAPFVLLDAPCTATGSIRRHPDIPYVRRPGDIAGAAPLQDALLDVAIAHLAPGGTLVYAVCSLEPEEGPQRIAAALARAPSGSLARRPITGAEVPGLGAAVTADGDLRTLPCHWADAGGIDGFFVCRLTRV